MHSLSEEQLLLALLALAVILVVGRSAGELARRTGQPEVLGQPFAGFILGPSIFGALLPSVSHRLFLDAGVSLVLSGFSWIGAILLLFIAGLEVDLAILRTQARPGALAAAFAILPSLAAGTLFAWHVLGETFSQSAFLGIVLSVTAVSVVATILMEREAMRRQFAQVLLAAGIATEVLVWLMVAVVSPHHGGSPLLAGALHAAYAVAYFLVMMTLARRFTNWAMRRVQDATWIIKGQLTLVLILAFVAAAITQALGLHPLLGAFVFGVLLSQAPRQNEKLMDGIQSLTVGLFGPIFFTIAGMRVDILQLGGPSSAGLVIALFGVGTLLKAGFSAVGARLGGQKGWEAALVGLGLSLKGGTDVVVAIVGTELGLLTVRAYTLYTVVAILTVLVSPPLLSWLEKKAPPSTEEQERLASEEASRRSYVPGVERVLVPVAPKLFPALAASVVERIAASKHEQGQLFDITQFEIQRESENGRHPANAEATDKISQAADLKKVQVTERRVDVPRVLKTILDTSKDYDLVAIGAQPPESNGSLSFGRLQDAIIHQAGADVLVAVDDQTERFDCSTVQRILVPVNGLEYSMAAGDVAGALADACNAELVILHVVYSDMDDLFWRERDRRKLVEAGHAVVRELAFRVSRLGIRVDECVAAGNPTEEILRELGRQEYQVVVLGAINRGTDSHPYLGKPVHTILSKGKTPAVLLISRA